jgi:hypothetical protein
VVKDSIMLGAGALTMADSAGVFLQRRAWPVQNSMTTFPTAPDATRA